MPTRHHLYGWVGFAAITLIAVIAATASPSADSNDTFASERIGPAHVAKASVTAEEFRGILPTATHGQAWQSGLVPLHDQLIDALRRCSESFQATPFGTGGNEDLVRFCADVEDRRPLIELVLDDLVWQRENSGQALDAKIAELTALPWKTDVGLRERLIDTLETCLGWEALTTNHTTEDHGRLQCSRTKGELEALLASAIAVSAGSL